MPIELGIAAPRRAVRIVVGLGNAERERRLVPELVATGEIEIVARCLAADQIPEAVRQHRADMAVLALDLHRLNAVPAAVLSAAGTPLVGLATRRDEQADTGTWAAIVPVDADSERLRAAILAVARGERLEPAAAMDTGTTPALLDQNASSRETDSPAGLIVVASGKGSPGCSTLAVNLAAALGAIEPTILVDLDLAGPSAAAMLGLNPRLNVYMLAHAEPRSSRDWSKALDQELQPLARRSPHAVVLAGIPKPDMRAAISPTFLQHLLPELRQRFQHVVLDVGLIQGAWGDWAWQSWVAGAASQVLLVSTASLVGLSHLRMALGRLPELQRDQVALVIGRYDRHTEHSRWEIEFAAGRPVAALIPYEHRAVERALWAQQPVIFARRSRAGRAFLELAERLHGGHILLPPESTKPRRYVLPKSLPRPRFGWPPLSAPVAAVATVQSTEIGEADGASAR